MDLILGSPVLQQVKKSFSEAVAINKRKNIAIIRFTSLESETHIKHVASEISAREKTRSFENIGFSVSNIILPENTSPKTFSNLISRLNNSFETIGIIVQLPTPKHLFTTLNEIDELKDIDALNNNNSHFKHCATSEAAFRLLFPYCGLGKLTAVVGSKGFVGSDICSLLSESKLDYIELEIGDDLLNVNQADILISATGIPDLLDERHLSTNHDLVIDIGFSPIPINDSGQYQILGDIKNNAKALSKKFTPVPGGIGPLEIAVLIERIWGLVSPASLARWSIDTLSYHEQSFL